MAECECLPKCLFFNDRMAGKPSLASLMKKQYCLGNNADCARHRIKAAAGAESVPPDLYPSQLERLDGILKSLGK